MERERPPALLWAGLNIEAADLLGTSAGSYYPMELIRALTLTCARSTPAFADRSTDQ